MAAGMSLSERGQVYDAIYETLVRGGPLSTGFHVDPREAESLAKKLTNHGSLLMDLIEQREKGAQA